MYKSPWDIHLNEGVMRLSVRKISPNLGKSKHYDAGYCSIGFVSILPPPEANHRRAWLEFTTSSSKAYDSAAFPHHRSRFPAHSRNSTPAFWALIVSTTSSHSMVYSKGSNSMAPSARFGYRIERWITNLPRVHQGGSRDEKA